MRFTVYLFLGLLQVHLCLGDTVRRSVTLTIATANLSDSTSQSYEAPGIRILQALKPDIVGIQEFNYKEGTSQDLARRIFGTPFYFSRESGGARLPNGILSRYPIVAHGQWEDPYVANRCFAWATIAIPGPKPLHVVSVHLLQRHADRRGPEARHLLQLIRSTFPENDYVVLCGDLNISTRNSEALDELTTWFLDDHQPADQNGNKNTNANRNRPYDFVLPNPALAPFHVPTLLAGHAFPDGLIFDTTLWDPPPPPAKMQDSVDNMQHMPVMKTFTIPIR